MSHEVKLQNMSIADLAHKCERETELYFSHQDYDSSSCFELFRRAIQINEEEAWTVIKDQYQPLVASWVAKWLSKYPDYSMAGEEAQDFIAQAFERFWISFTPVKFDKSQSLAAVLQYLQMCVNGAMTDTWRKMRHIQIEVDTGEAEREFAEPNPTPEDIMQADEFWQIIRKKSRNLQEYIVVYASFSLDLSPREILAEYPGVFSDIKEIYQHKANLLDRLERDEEIKNFILR
jgi:DNA-directed RNA polymerase specialized sigma24 family protein